MACWISRRWVTCHRSSGAPAASLIVCLRPATSDQTRSSRRLPVVDSIDSRSARQARLIFKGTAGQYGEQILAVRRGRRDIRAINMDTNTARCSGRQSIDAAFGGPICWDCATSAVRIIYTTKGEPNS
jgi:hypothetical protein